MKNLRIADIFLAIFFIVVGISVSLFLALNDNAGSKAQVYVDGKLFGTYNLEDNKNNLREIKIDVEDNHNLLVIEDGKIYMKESNCSGRECVKMGKINRKYQTIVCLPHRIMVKIKEKDNLINRGNDIDIISN